MNDINVSIRRSQFGTVVTLPSGAPGEGALGRIEILYAHDPYHSPGVRIAMFNAIGNSFDEVGYDYEDFEGPPSGPLGTLRVMMPRSTD